VGAVWWPSVRDAKASCWRPGIPEVRGFGAAPPAAGGLDPGPGPEVLAAGGIALGAAGGTGPRPLGRLGPAGAPRVQGRRSWPPVATLGFQGMAPAAGGAALPFSDRRVTHTLCRLDHSPIGRFLIVNRDRDDTQRRDHAAARPEIGEIREQHPQAYDQWSAEADAYVLDAYRSGRSVDDLAEELQCQPSAIESRLKKLAFDALRPPAPPGDDPA